MGDEIAWGHALAAQKRLGHSIGILHLTPGEKGHRTLPPAKYKRQKEEEAQRCANALGAEIWALPFLDGELPVDEEVKWAVADALREAQPRLVITHWAGSMHKDHASCHQVLPDARFYAGLPAFERPLPHHWVPEVLYGENWEDLRGYEPEVYVEVLQEDLDTYETAMRQYALFRGEVAKFPYLDYYKALARTRGCEVGFGFAVTFAVQPESRRKRVTSLI
jgi:LmbE family N-acetylglucosaminyl deacetylase